MLIRLYLWVFPRPRFQDIELKRLSNVCSDINGMTIVILVAFMGQNFFAHVTKASAILIIGMGVVYLLIERKFIFMGMARITVFTYGLALGAAWIGLTWVAGTLRHTQSMILPIGLAYVTITLGLKKGSALALIYTVLVLAGWAVEYDRSGFQLQVTDQLKYVSAAILSLVLLLTVCEILREHLVENYRLALIQRDLARDELVAANKQLTELLKATEGDLTQAVEVTTSALVKQQQFDNMDVLVSGLSHEMGTPIGNAKLAAENLGVWSQEITDNLPTDAARTKTLLAHMHESSQIVGNNLNRADELLKSFKRLSLDQTGAHMRDFKLAAAIERALFAMKPELGNTSLQIDLDQDIEMHSLPYAIEQIISNLVANAIKHGLEHSPDPRISITASRVKGEEQARIVVEDNGTGIDPKVMPMIFNPFFTTRRGRGGSGMGLSVVRYLAETVLGATINVQSNPLGTRFEVIVPLKTEGVWADPVPVRSGPMPLTAA